MHRNPSTTHKRSRITIAYRDDGHGEGAFFDHYTIQNITQTETTISLPQQQNISAWFKKALFWVADRVTKPTNRWYKSQLHRSSLKTQYFFMQRV